ncbi:unnamed protein product [Prunus brigantina]
MKCDGQARAIRVALYCSWMKLEDKIQPELRLDLAAVLRLDLLRVCGWMKLETEMRPEWLHLGVFRSWSCGVFWAEALELCKDATGLDVL